MTGGLEQIAKQSKVRRGGQKNDEGGGGSSRGKAKKQVTKIQRYNTLFGVLKVLVPKK